MGDKVPSLKKKKRKKDLPASRLLTFASSQSLPHPENKGLLYCVLFYLKTPPNLNYPLAMQLRTITNPIQLPPRPFANLKL